MKKQPKSKRKGLAKFIGKAPGAGGYIGDKLRDKTEIEIIDYSKEQFQVLSELQPAIGVRQRHGVLDIVCDSFASRIGQVINRQDNDVIANTYAPVLAPIP